MLRGREPLNRESAVKMAADLATATPNNNYNNMHYIINIKAVIEGLLCF